MSKEVWLVLAGAAGPVLIAIATIIANAITSKKQWQRQMEAARAQSRYERVKADVDVIAEAFDATTAVVFDSYLGVPLKDTDGPYDFNDVFKLIARAAWRAVALGSDISDDFWDFAKLAMSAMVFKTTAHTKDDEEKARSNIVEMQYLAGQLQHKMTDYLAHVKAGEWREP